ncbi:uncharacterized protein LOC133185331 [Saccostrea echinata]|uniref:uncharacterized protein LOC133185331 n=1 Tax=Saccostrea echinata TaxID=191078 RepID=UPI002A7EC655|nr:uncharacterized protein LOC133185331 [Saccostrea echinata]
MGKYIKSDVVVIHGLKAVGKSSLARQFCELVDCKSVWIDLKYVVNCEGLLKALGRQILHDGFTTESLDEMLTILTENIAHRKEEILIIFDNAEDIYKENQFEFANHIIESLARIKNVKILITSITSLSMRKDNFDDFHLRPMCFFDSVKLLGHVCPSLKETTKIGKIVELCEGIPLAMLLSGAEIADDNNPLNAEDIIELLSRSRLRILSSEYYAQDDRIDSKYKGFLERLSEALEEHLAVINYMPGSFNEDEARKILGLSDEESQASLRMLHQRHLVSTDRGGRFNIHGILRDCIREYLKIKDLKGVRTRFCHTFANILKEIENKSQTEDYAGAMCMLNVEHQNFQQLFTDVIHCTEDTYPVFVDLAATTIADGAVLFTAMSTYEFGIEYFEKCLQKTREFKEEIDESKVLTGYGRVLTNIKGNYDEGEKKFRVAFELRKQHPERRDFYLALLCQAFGWNLGCQGKFSESLSILEMAFEIEKELKMYYENLILQTMQSLAIFYNISGGIGRGEPLQHEVLRRRRHVIGTDKHPIIGSVMNNMGIMYKNKGDHANAVHFFQKSLEIKLETNAALKAIIFSERNVAENLIEMGENEKAIGLLTKSLERFENIPDLYYDVRSMLYETLGKAYSKSGHFENAATSYKKALELRYKISVCDLTLLALAHDYAKCLISLGKNEKAERVLQRELRLRNLIIEQDPTNLIIIDCIMLLMDVKFTLRLKEELVRTFNHAKDELHRLILVFENLRNFNKREEMSERLTKLKLKFDDMMKTFDVCSETRSKSLFESNAVLYSFCLIKVCLVILTAYIKARNK